MKHIVHLILALLAVLAPTSLWADDVSPYTADFNTAINTSDHGFRVASNWKHIVGKYTDNYDWTYYMSYSYKEDRGVDGTGCLSAEMQKVGDYGDEQVVYDLLVTPVVSGTVTL